MGGFVQLVTKGRTQAIAVAAAALLLPPFSFIAGSIVCLITLRQGIYEGGLVLAASATAAGIVTGLLLGTPVPMLAFIVFPGLPLLLIAAVLRMGSSQGLALGAAGLMGAMGIAAIHGLIDDPVAWRRAMFVRLLFGDREVAELGLGVTEAQRMNEVLDLLAQWSSLPIMAVLVTMLMVFLARWWHSLIDNPGGFGKEFRDLRLDRRIAYVTIPVALATLLPGSTPSGISAQLFQLMVVLFAIQGIALAHSVRLARKASLGWLVMLYLLLFFIAPTVVLFLSMAGFSDTWAHYRQRLRPSA